MKIMNKLFIILFLVFTSASFAALFNDDVRISKRLSGSLGGTLTIDSTPQAVAPRGLMVKDSATSNKIKIWPFDSTSVAHADSSDTANYAAKAGYADTAAKAGTAYGFVHGVPVGTLLKSSGAASCTSSHVSESGDTTRVTYAPAVADTFYNSSLTGTRTFQTGCKAANGDCYFAKNQDVGNGEIHIQYSGAGALVNLSQANKYYNGLAAISNGDVYVSVYNDTIRKRTGGTGNFAATSLIGHWYDLSSYQDTLYALNADSAGYLVSIDPVAETMVRMGITPEYQFVKLAINSQGDFYLIRSGSYDIYKVTKGTSTAVAMGFTARQYSAIGIDSANTLYLGTTGAGAIYRQFGGAGSLTLFQAIGTPMTDFFYKSNGDVYATTTNKILLKSSENTKTIFHVTTGNSQFSGEVAVETTPVTTIGQYMMVKNSPTDHTIRAQAIQSIIDSSHAVVSDSATGADRLDGLHENAFADSNHTQTQSTVIGLTDSLAVKIGGSGTIGYLSKFTSSGAIGNSGIIDSGKVISTYDTTIMRPRNWNNKDYPNNYYQIGDQIDDSSSFFKMYSRGSTGWIKLQGRGGISLSTPGCFTDIDSVSIGSCEEGVAYINSAKRVTSLPSVNSTELGVLDGAGDTIVVVDSLFDGGTFRTASTATVYKIGRMVTVSFGDLLGTVTAGTNTYIKFGSNLPLPTYANLQPHVITNNGGQVKMGWLYGASTGLRTYRILNYDNSNLAAGNSGISSATWTFICTN